MVRSQKQPSGQRQIRTGIRALGGFGRQMPGSRNKIPGYRMRLGGEAYRLVL